jgi:flagellar hook-associated protein 2
MATISSLGIGSGLDSEAIVTKLVALEKSPLTALQNRAKIESAQISEFAKVKSQVSALADAASAMSTSAAWSGRSASSSNANAVAISATSSATPTSFTLDVDALAKQQSVTSVGVPTGSNVGAGTMTLRLGTWTGIAASTAADAAAAAAATAAAAAQTAFVSGSTEAATYDAANTTWLAAVAANTPTVTNQQAEDDALAAKNAAYAALSGADVTRLTTRDNTAAALVSANNAAAAARPTFSPSGSSSDVVLTVLATDTVATLAAKINSANAGVVATTVNDGSQDRLILRSKDTGAAFGFRVQTSETDNSNSDATGLSRFAYNPAAGAYGAATVGNQVQAGENARVRINGLAVTSASNTLSSNIPGVTINLLATTTTNYNNVGGTESRATVTLAVSEDVTVAVRNVNNFITAYNALASNLAELTRYDEATKTPGLFQGDASMLGIQSVLRNMASSVTSGSTYARLADVGIERQLNGTLALNTARFSTAANNGTELQKLFITNNGNTLTDGFALKFKNFASGALASGGSVVSKANALQKKLDTNTAEQTRVNDRAAAVEARLRRQYSALDAKMASLNALNAYVAQQVTTWNQSKN